MSFKFNWPDPWDPALIAQLKEKITEQMNKNGPPHPAIVDRITMKDIYFGTKAPVFKLEQIVELTNEIASLVFFVSYAGDAHITIHTRIQINKVTPTSTSYLYYSSLGRSSLSQKPLEMPLDLTLANIRFEARVRVTVNNLPVLHERDIQQKLQPELQQPKLQPKLSIQVLSWTIPHKVTQEHSQEQLVSVVTNFDQQLPQVRDTFQDIIEITAKTALKELQNNPIEINL